MVARSMGFLAVTVAICLSAIPAWGDETKIRDSAGSASESDIDRARRLVEEAVQAFEQGDYVTSSHAWAEAVRLRPTPALVFNHAQALRMAGEYAESIQQYERYLIEVPDAKNRGEVERLIAEMAPLVEETVGSEEEEVVITEVDNPPAFVDSLPPESAPASWETPFWLKVTLAATAGALAVGSAVAYGVSRTSVTNIGALPPDLPGVEVARRNAEQQEMTAIGLGGGAVLVGVGAVVAFTF